MCEAFFDHLQRRTFPGGCFFAGAALEWASAPVPSRKASPHSRPGSWTCSAALRAPPSGRTNSPADEDPEQLAFELNGIILATDANFVLHDNPAVLDLARHVVHRRLGLSNAGQR